TGEIQYRIAKADWSNFDESDDYSYLPKAPYAENDHITAYYKGDLIYGMEPDTGSFLRAGTTGIDESGTGGFSVYPNPVTDKLTIMMTGENAGEVQITLHNALGKLLLIQEVQGTRQELDMSPFPRGVYIVTVTGSGTSAYKKIIKE
ncbi:MAG TPA: T9SS type A sorting domain-containing protein, partial [Balneolales bacterium]|nr:T9SS type A sorting domain-containing protein [Balneolales bacterium]